MNKEGLQKEISKLQELLKKEKDEDLLQYKNKMSSTSFVERRNKGVCWYPVYIERAKYNSGERLMVRVSRDSNHLVSHSFQSGKMVSLFSNAGENDEHDEYVNGVVNQVREHEMLITLNSDILPHWIHDGHLGVQLLFDENSYREMEHTLKFLQNTKDERLLELMQVFLGKKDAQFTDQKTIHLNELNQSQNKALNQVLSAKDLAIIHGPPGTGKTTTLIYAILETLKSETQLLVCAPSNAAADLLAERLGDQGVNVLRVGHPARVTEKILSKTLDRQVTLHKSYKNLKEYRKQAEEYRTLGRKYKRNFGHDERQQRKRLLNEARKLRDEAENLLGFIIQDILLKTRVIISTLVGSNGYMMKDMRFQTVFIDEAAQALEPATWIPIIKSQRVIFAGDHFQLPPTIKSTAAAKQGLGITLFEKAVKNNSADTLLREQYRMNEQIMGFSNKLFYENKLIANTLVSDWKIFPEDLALEFIDTAGTGFSEQQDKETRSSINPEEGQLLFKHLAQYLENLQSLAKLDELDSIGIIAPYRAQITFLQENFGSIGLDDEIESKIAINTIDSFQGQEKDIVYISLVRSNEKGEIGFLADTRRMNVALTRARKKLVIIGDSATIGRNDFYKKFLDYVDETGAYRSAFELLY